MSQNLDLARSRLEEAATLILVEMGDASTDEQQESLALMEKGINDVEVMINAY